MPNQEPIKYDYKTVEVSDATAKNIDDICKSMSMSGWELHSQSSPRRGVVLLTFRRVQSGCCLVATLGLASLLVSTLTLAIISLTRRG